MHTVHNVPKSLAVNCVLQILYVHAGVWSGESEEVVDGFVWHNNPNGIKGSWKAIDPESGIAEYIVSVGTSPGN